MPCRRLLVTLVSMLATVGLACTLLPAVATAQSNAQFVVTVSTPDGSRLEGELVLYYWDAESGYFDTWDYWDIDDRSPLTRSISAPEGDYYVAFYDYGDRFATGYSGGATTDPEEPGDPGTVTLVATRTTTTRIDLTALPARVPVTGRLVDDLGVAVSDKEVTAQTTEGDEAGSAQSGTGGSFTFQLRPGNYRLRVAEDSTHVGRTVSFTVGTSPVALGSIVLDRARYVRLSGEVRTSAGSPAAGAEVSLYRLVDYDGDGTMDGRSWEDGVTALGSGSYSFPEVRAGRAYTVGAAAPGHVETFLGGATTVLAGQVVHPAADTAVSPITLHEASTVGGRVTGPDGEPEPGVTVHLVRWHPDYEEFYSSDSVETDAGGRYVLDFPEAGFYTLRFDGSTAARPVKDAWLVGNDKPQSTSSPGVLSVTSQVVHLTADRRLAAASRVSGLVVGPDGQPTADVDVTLYRWDADGEYLEHVGSRTTGPGGRYALTVPSDGDFTLHFDPWQSSNCCGRAG